MLLVAEPEETSGLKSKSHAPIVSGAHIICYRCGMLLGPSNVPKLGTLLDY